MWASLAWLWLAPARAEVPVPPDGTVERVQVEGTARIEEAAVLAKVGLRRGEALSESRVRRDLEAVYATGFFDDVVVELRGPPEARVVVFRVREKPAIRETRIEGEKKIDEDDLREAMDLRAFQVLNEAKVAQTVEAMRDLYVEKGYYLAEIRPEIVEVSDDRVDVIFHIEEGKKVTIQKIAFAGNDHVPAGKIRRFLEVKQGGLLSVITGGGNFDRDKLDVDAQRVSYVFLEEGYADVQVDPPKVYLSPDKRSVFISYTVREGELYHLGNLAVEGDFEDATGLTHDRALEILAGRPVAAIQDEQWRAAEGKKGPKVAVETKAARLVPGDVFKYSTVSAVASALEVFYQDQGYAFVNVVPDTRTNAENRTVDIVFRIEKGEKMRVGRIDVSGNDTTFDKVIRREIRLVEGQTYRGSLIRASQARLRRLGYFDEVDVSTPRGEDPGELDVVFRVSEQPTGSFQLGAGYSTLESIVINASVSKNNFLGLGYTMGASVNWSKLQKQYQVSFVDPYFADTRWSLRFDTYSVTRQFQLDEYQRGGSVGVGRYLDTRDDIELRGEYTLEDVGLNNIDPYRAHLFGGQLYRNGLTSTVGSTIAVDKRNDRLFPTRGFYTSASAGLSGGFRVRDDAILSLLGGSYYFAETKFNFRLYQPVIPRSERLIFRLNTTLGNLMPTDGGIIPYIHRYRAGGIQSVRGYQWYSLGPRVRSLSTDDPMRADDELIIGGTRTWINNLELEAPIIPAAGINAVVFFDAGNAFGDVNGRGPIDPTALRFSYGLGVRWRSPIGPLRFEYGVPIQPLEDERKSVFDFGIGSFF